MVTSNIAWNGDPVELLSTRDRELRDVQLTRDDWIVAAIQTLVRDGIEAVHITQLSRDLNVTRGSFYWHFKNRKDVLDSILLEWRARNSGIMMEVLKTAPTLEAGILDLFAVWVDHSKFDPALDQAVRDWARRDENVRAFVATEDNDRVGAIAAFFKRHNYEKIDAFIRARIIYFTQLSYYALDVSEPLETRVSYLAAYFRSFTGREIDPSVVKAFRSRLQAQKKKS